MTGLYRVPADEFDALVEMKRAKKLTGDQAAWVFVQLARAEAAVPFAERHKCTDFGRRLCMRRNDHPVKCWATDPTRGFCPFLRSVPSDGQLAAKKVARQ